ncbi:ADP-ribosyltransferase [Nocardiopsis sp. N85]|uniref:ADP-ribosyltransferase n=1 Tax=Nocardiopsis sp. N85 TaxID=3029400 RepID=UPI00237F2368|nr:ADP-ribosyltransferase [Nocardiopsis sp. N85]MDE3721919.1 ADP-ribosyltransferase [Nocardiopsis sp. N85]
MGDSAHDFVKVMLGIDLPRASAPAMRAASEVYDVLDQRLHELSDVMDTTRNRIRRNFGGAASDHYDRSLAAFTSGEKDYIGNAAGTSRMLSAELRKAAANVDYMVAMVWVQVAQLIAEITWAIATAKFTFGASLKWIPVFKAIRSLAIRRLIAWFLVTVPSHQIVSQVFASFGALIQRVQIANGDRDGFDHDLLRDAHVGAVIEGLVSAGMSGGVGAFVNSGFANAFIRNIDDLRGMPDPPPPPLRNGAPDPAPPPPLREGVPDPVPPPPVREGGPDPVPPPHTLNGDLADLFTRHRDEMLVPFHPNSPTGARSWDNAVERNAFRAEMAGVFQRAFAERLGVDQARRLGDDYADTLIRSWGDPDLGSRLSRTIGDRLPPPLREHLSDVPQNLAGSLHESARGFWPYLRGLGLGAGTGAAEGVLGEGLGGVAGGQGFTVTPWSATSGATMNTAHQLTTDSALAGIDALSGPGGTLLPPDLPPPPEPERPTRAEEDPAQGGAPVAGPATGNGGGRPTPAGGPVIAEITVVPPVGGDEPARGDGDGSHGGGDEAPANGADAHRTGGSPVPNAGDQDTPAARRPRDHDPDGDGGADARGPNPPERTAGTPEAPAARHDPGGADHTDAHRSGDAPAPLAGDRHDPVAGTSRDRAPVPSHEEGTEGSPPLPAAVTPPAGADRAAPPQGTAPPGRPSGEAGGQSRPGPQETPRSRPEPPPVGEAGPERNGSLSPVTVESPAPAGGRETAAPATESTSVPGDPAPAGTGRSGTDAPPAPPTAVPSTANRNGSAPPYSFDASLNPVVGVPGLRDADDDNASLGDTESDTSSLFDEAASDTSSPDTAWSDTEDAPPAGAAPGHPAVKDPKESEGVADTPGTVPGSGPLAFPVTESGPAGRAPSVSAPSDGPAPATVRTDPQTPPSGEGAPGTARPETDGGEAAPVGGPADARAERAADLVAQARRHLGDGDVAQARAVSADIQDLLSPRPDDGAPQNPSVRRARTLALGLVFTLSDPADRRAPADRDAFSADRAEDAATLLGGVERNLRDRHDAARARLWLPGGSLTTQYVRDTLPAAPPTGAPENGGAPVPSTGDAPPAAATTTPDTTGGTPVPTQSAGTDTRPAPPAAGPGRTADGASDTPGKAGTDPTASGTDPSADARAASVLSRLPELTRALADNDIPGARALGAEFWRLLRPAGGPAPENRSVREARTLAQALVYVVSDPSDRRVPLSGGAIPPERVRDAEVLARGIGRHLRDRHDPVRARLWLPGGRLTTDYVRYAMQDPADRGPSPYGAPVTATTVNMALVDGEGSTSTPVRTEDPGSRATDGGTEPPPSPLSPAEAAIVAERARATAENALGLARGAADRVSAAARTATDGTTATSDAVAAAEQAVRAREEAARAAGAARDAARLAVEAGRGTASALDRAGQEVRGTAPGTDAHRAAADAEAAVRTRHEETVRLRDEAERHARDAEAVLRDAAATADDALTAVSRRVAGDAEQYAARAGRAADGAAHALRVTREAADRATRATREVVDAADTATAVTAAEQALQARDAASTGAESARLAANQAQAFAQRASDSVALAERITRVATPGTDAHRAAADNGTAARDHREQADRHRDEAETRVGEATTARHASTTATVDALAAAVDRAAFDSAGTRMAADEAYRRSGIAENRRARVEEAVRAAAQADAARPRRLQDVQDAARRLTDAVRETREAADAAGRARTTAEASADPGRVAGTTAALDSLVRVATELRNSEVETHPDTARLTADLMRTNWVMGGARRLVGDTGNALADARRYARNTEDSADRAEALLPGDLPSPSRLHEKTDTRYDLEYLVTSRLSGPDRLFTRAAHQAVADIVRDRITDPPADLTRLVDTALSDVAHEHGMLVFFAPGGREITVTDPGTDTGTDGADAPRSWTVRVALASEDPGGYRHLDVEHRESGAPLESREEERSHSTTTGGTSSYDPRRILAARFTGSPLLLGDVSGSAAGPWVTVGGSFSRGQRAASQGGTTEAASKIEYTTFAKPEFYANDLRVWAEVTAGPEGAGAADDGGSDTGGAPPPAVGFPIGSSVVRDGMVFTLAGEVQGRPDEMPRHIDLAPGAGEGTGPGRRPRNLGPVGGLPIAVHSVTPNTPVGSGPAHTDLGSWVADYLVSDTYRLNREVSSENAAVQWMKDVTGPGTGQDIAQWKHEIREVLNNDSFQEYLPHLDRGPVTVSVSHPRLGEVMMEFSATPRDYRIKDHSPLIDDATFKESIKDETSLTQSRNTSFTLTGGTGFGLVAELPSGGTLRVNAPHVEATWWRSLSSESHNTSGSGEHRSLGRYVSSTEKFAAYQATHDLSVHVQGEAAPHRFTVTGVELLPGETAGRLDRAARNEEAADGGGDAGRRPPFPHLESDNPVHFRGSHFLGLEWSGPAPRDAGEGEPAVDRDADDTGDDGGSETSRAPAPPVTSDDRRGVLERYLDDVLAGIAREHPGLVIPELARDRDTYAHRPGREGSSYFERSFREHWGFRRSYDTAYKNTMLVRDTIQGIRGTDALERLARPGEGLPLRLRESATVDPTLMAKLKEFFRPDTVTVRLHAQFGRLSHDGTSTAETGLRVRGTASASTESATGSAFTLAVSAGSGMVRSAEGDARGFARLLGGFMASVGYNRVNHFDAAYGLEHKSDARLFFPEGSDRWNGEVTLGARLHDYDADEQAYGTDQGTELLDRPVKATYSLITATTVGDNLASPEPAPDRADEEQAALSPEEAREMLDPRPGRRDPAEEDTAETGDGTGTTREETAPETGTTPPEETGATSEAEGESPAAPETDNTRVLLDHGAIIEHVNPLLQETGDTGPGPGRGLLRRTLDAFSRPRRFWSDGGRMKLSAFLDGVGGATLLSNLMSPTAVASDPASFSESGRRRRIEVPGTWLSPNDMRATGVTRVTVGEITDLRQTRAQVTVQSETASTASAAVTRIGGFFARFTGFAGGTTNTIEEGGADSGVDRSSADGIVPMAGPSHNRSLFRRGETTDSGVSSASGLLLLPRSAAVYAFTAAGTIAQAWEFKKHRGLNFPNWWTHRYTGWKTRVDDLVSGYITARDAEQAGIITDAVTHGDDGTPAPATQPNPTPPPHARVRPGFDSAGRQALPVDPARAVDTLETHLRTHGLTLSRGGKERLLVTLSEQLGTATDALPPIPVNVVSTDRNAHFSKPARVLVDLTRTAPRVDYVTSAAATVETHSWQAENSHQDSRESSSTTGWNFAPWQTSGKNGGSDPPPDSSLFLTSPFAGADRTQNESQGRSSSSETTHTIVMESSGPYVKVSQDASLTLTIEVDGDGLVPTAGIRQGGKSPYLEYKPPIRETVTVDGGRIRTFHLGSSLDFTPPAAPAAALDAVPAPPAATPRAGDTLADAVTTATGELTPPPAALRDAIIMPTAVHGPDLRDTALRTVAASLGWRPPATPAFGPTPTAEQLGELREHHRKATDDARRHIADHLELDARYTPIDNSLNPVSLKGLLSHNLGRPSGTDILRIGRTRWRAAATPDFTGARIITARPDARLVHKEAEGQGVSHSRSQGGGTNTTTAFRPTGHDTVDAGNSDRNAFLTGSGDGTARTITGESPTGDDLATGEPSDMERQRLGTAYLVEFDTTWTIGARTDEKAFFGGTTPRQFTSHHTNRTSAWISQSDAIALGVLTPEQAAAADAPITAEYNASKAMGDAEAAYTEERAKLPALVKAYLDAHTAHAAAATPANRTALDAARTAYEAQDAVYRTTLGTYNDAIAAWTTAANATRTHLDGMTPPGAPPAPAPRTTSSAPLGDQLRPVFGLGPRETSATTDGGGTTTEPGSRAPAPVPAVEASGSGTTSGPVVFALTDITGEVRDPDEDAAGMSGAQLDSLARGLGLTDTDDTAASGSGTIRRLPTGADADRYGDLLHDPGYNPNAFDAQPTATQDAVAAYTRSAWLNRIARMSPLNEATVQAELDRIRDESRSHPGWQVYEIGGGRWPDLARLEEAAEQGGLSPEQEGVVRRVLDSRYPQAALDDLYERSGRAGRIAESLALRGETAHFPDSSEVLALIRRLDRATGQPFPEGFEAVHGMYQHQHLLGEGSTDARSLAGTTHVEQGYFSVSLGTVPSASGGSPIDLMRLTVPESARGLWVGDRSEHPGEREVILTRGTRYRINTVEPWGRGYLFHAEILPPAHDADGPAAQAPTGAGEALDRIDRALAADDTATALAEVRGAAERVAADLASVLRDVGGPGRSAAIDRLERLRDAAERLADRASAMADTAPEAVTVTVALVADLAATAQGAAARSAAEAAAARDAVPEPPEVDPEDPDRITDAARERDTAITRVTDAAAARDDAERAARIAYEAADTAARTARTAEDGGGPRVGEARAAAEAADARRRAAITAAEDAADRHDSLTRSVNIAANIAVGIALDDVAAARGDAAETTAALDRARSLADLTAPGSAARAKLNMRMTMMGLSAPGSDGPVVFAVTDTAGEVRDPDGDGSGMSGADLDSLARGLGLTDADDTAALVEVREAAERLSAEAVGLAATLRNAGGPDRTAAIDRLEQLRDEVERLADRATAMAGTSPEAVGTAVGLAADLAAAAQHAAARGATDARTARDAVPEPPAPPPTDLDGITDAARERDSAVARVTDAAAARDDAERAARIAYEAADTAARTARTAEDRARAEQARTAAKASDAERRVAVTAAQDAAGRQEALAHAVDTAAAAGVGTALDAAATAHGNARDAAAAVEHGRDEAVTAAVDATDARNRVGEALASGDRDAAVTEAVRALREADTARDARDEMVRQAGIADRESDAARAALDRARSIADLTSPGSEARTALDARTRTAPLSDTADASGPSAQDRTRADAAVRTARAASREALSLPLDSVRLHGREARESAELAVNDADALVTDTERQREEAAAAARTTRAALDRTRVAGDRAGARAARDEAATAADRAQDLARGARAALTDARAALTASSDLYDSAIDAARADADAVRRIAALAPGSTAAAETAYRTHTAVHTAEARMEADVDRLERAEEGLHQAEEAVRRIEELAAQARRAADDAREQAEHPRVYPGTVRRDGSADTYDLDYLVRSRIIGPDRLYTERVPEVVGHLITAQAPDMPAALHANVAARIDHIAREHGMAVFFSPEGVDVTVTDGTGDDARTWTVRVALESAEPDGYRHLALPHREAGAPLESREEERSHSAKTSGTSTHDPRRGISGRFTASPLLLGDVTGAFAAGPWLTAGGGYAGGRRGASFGGSEQVGSDLEYTTFSPPEVYLGDLRVRVRVTENADGEPDTGAAPGGTPPADPGDGFQSGVVENGVALVLAGEVKARPDGTPDRIDLRADRPGGDGAHARTPNRPVGALPISVTSVTPRGDGAGRHSELGSWLAEYLVSRDYAPHRTAMDSLVMRLMRKSTEARIREWQAEIRAFFDNDSVQEYLPFLGSAPMTVSVTHPVLGEVMLRLSSTPDRYTAKAHTPLMDDATLKHTVETSTALGVSRNSGFTATVGGGFGVLIPLSTGGSIRLNMPHLEYTYWRSLSSQAESGSEAGHNRSLARYVSDTETFTAFDSESTLSVQVQGETTAHEFDARAVEILPGEGSAALQRAVSGEEAHDGADAGRTPPLPHLRGTRVTDFSGTHHDTLTRVPRPEGGETAAPSGEAPAGADPRDASAADDRGVLEEITDRVLAGIAREHPGLVIPELARDQRTYARRPGRENAPYFERSFREHWGLRRDYRTAYQNTIDVANTVRDAMHNSNRDRLASSEGLTVVLRETASIDPSLMVKNPEFLRPDVLTLSLKADFSGLSHQGTTTAETGLRTGGDSTLAAESGRGASHTLTLSAGSGLMRSAESDARGAARLLGGLMASLGLSRLNHGEAAHGVSHGSNQRFIFPGGSDRWGGTVDFTARLHTQEPSLSGRPDGGVDLLGEPVRARYSLITPKDTAQVPLRGGEAKPAGDLPFTAQDARALIDPRPEDLAVPDPVDADGRRARAVIENGATIERVSLAVPGGDATRSSGGVLRRAFEAFTDQRPVSDGRRGKLRGFLDTVGGRHFFTDFLSPVSLATDPATFSPSGHRGRVDLGGTWRSPNDMRATGATSVQPERIVDVHAVKAQLAVAGDTTSTASAGELKLTSATLGATGFAGGTSNTIEEGGAASGADRSTADGIVPMAGPSHNWNFFRRGEITDSGVSSTSGLFLLSKAATVYTFRMAGTISQAWEFKKHRGLNLPQWWSHKYAGWKTRVDDLVSGYITARDAEQAGIITDAVTHGDDGTPAPATQPNPTPPPHARVRPGFDGAGQQRRPADPTAAIRELEVRLREQGLKLTRGGRERLLAHLTRRLGSAPGALPPVPVTVVRAAGTSRFLHRSQPARVLVELNRTNPRVDYVTSAVATVETHSWQTESAQAESRGSGHTSGAAFTPWQPSGANGGTGPSPDSHFVYASPAAGATAHRSTTETDSSAEEETHTVVMESSGPYARVTHDTSLTLTLETGGRPPVRAQADSGAVQTFHLGSSLDFTPPAAPAAPLDTVPAPPTATPRAGDTLAGAVTTATEALGDPALAPRIRDAVIMPTAVHGPDPRDTAVRTVAASLGWKPPATPDFGESPTAEQLDRLGEHHRTTTGDARRHIAEQLKLDPRYTPIDNTLNPVALKGLFSRAVGQSAGVDILRIGRTRWRVAATPDFTGARVLTARPDARLVHKEAEGQSVSHSRSQGGATSATAGFRPTGHHTVDADDNDRTAFLTGSGDAAARTITRSSPTANGLVTGEPSDMERQRLGTAYLVEFDTTWTIGARSENTTPFGPTVQQFTADHTNKTSAWISQSDAIALGIITPEQATAADAPITAEHQAAKTMADAEAAYTEARAELPALVDAYLDAHAAHAADPTPANRTALDDARAAYETRNTAYRTALTAYDDAVTAWTSATNATAAHLAGLTRSDAPPSPPPGPATGAPLSDRMERELGARPATASLLDTFHSALNTQPAPVGRGPATGEETSGPEVGPPPRPTPGPNTDD